MSKPDGSTAAQGGSAPDTGPAPTTLTAANAVDRVSLPTPHGAATAVTSEAGPKRTARGRAEQHPRLDSDLQAAIGQQLRAVYHEVLNEPVPDRFVLLLKQLATKSADQQ